MSPSSAAAVDGPLADALSALGWAPTDDLVRTIAPTALRRHPVACAVPPAGRYLAPAVAAALSVVPEGERALLLVPEALLEDAADAVRRVATALGQGGVLAGASLGRVSNRLSDPGTRTLVTTPAVAFALQSRASLPLHETGLLVLGWPELWDDRSPLPGLLQDLPDGAQRIVLSADPGVLADLVERHARKALVAGLPPAGPEVERPGPVRAVVVPRHERARALHGILDVLDPASVAVWVPEPAEREQVERELAALTVPTQAGAALEEASCVVTWSLPRAEELATLVGLGGEVVVLVPPAATAWLGRTAGPVRPLRLAGVADAVETQLQQQRRVVSDRLATGTPVAGLQAIAPLLERHEATAVAGALFELWQANRPAATAPPAPGSATAASAPAAAVAVWVGVGRRDGATPADFVAVLTKEVGLDRTQVGRIEIKESFSLVEVPAAQVEEVARRLDGRSIRGRRVSARPDRGGTPARSGGPPRSGGGPPRGAGRPGGRPRPPRRPS